MSFLADSSLNDRLQAAARAREAARRRFLDRPNADDPAVQARRAERKAIVDARERRAAEREAAREAEEERKARDAIAEREAEIALQAAQAAAAAEQGRLALARQKEERDARYAARKAKIKSRRWKGAA